MMKKNVSRVLNNQKGFTLIEIIAVLVILGILAAVAVPKYIDLQEEARNKSASAAIAETQSRLSMSYGKFLLSQGTPPASIAALCTWVADTTILPAAAAGDVPMGSDYTVTLAATGAISVSVVQTATLSPAITGAWALP